MPTPCPVNADFFPNDKKHYKVLGLFLLFYLVWVYFLVGWRSDHIYFMAFITIMMTAHRWTRTFTYLFVFFIIFWIIYDGMRVFPNYMVSDINITQPYDIEKQMFGIDSSGTILTPNEYMQSNSHQVLDFLSGIFYLSWMPVPLGLGVYLFFNNKKMLLRFSAAFLFTNLIGFVIYYSYPAAPPWYYDQYGDHELFNVVGDPAQLKRFDVLIGYPLFSNIYTKNSNVFAAIPSLHAAYPVVAWFYAFKSKLKIAHWVILIDIAGIWFAAVYSFHHYFIDVLLGFLCAVIAILIFEKWLIKTKLSIFFDQYLKFVQS
ncbi:MAG: phosphatase PAP2 family protein [Saprospiraceae bacterium]